MRSILLGHDRKTNEPIRMPTKVFQTHLHLIGGTGKGKTTALQFTVIPLPDADYRPGRRLPASPEPWAEAGPQPP